jgi:hypothetical protein
MFKKLVLASALTVIAVAASAQTGNGYYAGVDTGKTKFDSYEARESSFGVFAGYKVSDQMAIEGNYREIWRGRSFDARQVGLSAVGSVPLSSGLNVYGRLGLNHLSSKAKFGGHYGFESATRILYGFGAGYAFTPTVSARIEIQNAAENLTNLSLGLAYQF